MALDTELLEQWIQADASLKELKTLEASLRDQVVDQLVGDIDLEAGTHQFYEGGRELKLVIRESLTIDKGELNVHDEDLTEMEMAAIKWEPKLVKPVYDRLPTTCVLRMNVVTKKRGKPSLTLVS